jgi:hypothetical protein
MKFMMDLNEIIEKLNRKKIFLIVVIFTAYTYSAIQWIYPIMNAKSTVLNITGGLISFALLLLLTYLIPKIINYPSKNN